MNITNNRLPPPAPLPDIEAAPSRDGAVEFFRGMWFGLAIGCVIGAGFAVIF